MKLRLIFAVSLFLILILLLGTQARFIRAAELGVGLKPITPPITYFLIKGSVSYRFQRLVRPAPGVTVEASNNKIPGYVVRTVTDYAGNYTLSVEPGKYRVRPFDSLGTRFIPPFRLVKVSDQDIEGVSFVGLRRLLR